MSEISKTAMVLAAGLGARMRPLTLQKPKPLFEVGGRSMLDHALDRLVAVGIERAVVNTYYLSEQIAAHLEGRSDIEIIISHETELLDTGGGIKNALRYLGDKPFFALNADLPWLDAEESNCDSSSLNRMMKAWDAAKMDALLLLMSTQKARGFAAMGDYAMESDGRVWRKDLQPPRSYVMMSAQIIKPEPFSHYPDRIFSNSKIWDQIEVLKRLYGIEHHGSCYHVGTAEDLQKANDLLSSGQGWG